MTAFTRAQELMGRTGSRKEELVRSFSAQCEEALSEYEFGDNLVYSNPITELPYASVSPKSLIADQERDRAYFVAYFSELQQQFRGKYVAIRNQTVIDADEDLLQLLRRIRSGENAEKRYYVHKVNNLFWAEEGAEGVVVF